MRCVSIIAVLLVAALAVLIPQNVFAGFASEWDFTNRDFTAVPGSPSSVTMSYVGDTATTAPVSFVDATINGVSKKVMSYDAFKGPNQHGGGGELQGLLVSSGALENYTMIWDINLPGTPQTTGSYDQWATLLQTNTAGTTDAAYCTMPTKDSTTTYKVGLGSGVGYGGSMAYGEWQRIALTVSTDSGISTATSYVNGTQVCSATYPGTGAAYNRFRIDSSGFLLFTDDDGETSRGYLSAFALTDSVLTSAQIGALGGVSASGILSVPEPGTVGLLTTGLVALIAYAWRRRK